MDRRSGPSVASFLSLFAACVMAFVPKVALAAEPRHGGEASLVLPDLSSVRVLGTDGHSLLMVGLLVSALGYLGVGAQPPTSEWGRMLSDAQKYILTEPYIAIFPGVAIALTVIGFNLAGDGLRDAFDPVVKR